MCQCSHRFGRECCLADYHLCLCGSLVRWTILLSDATCPLSLYICSCDFDPFGMVVNRCGASILLDLLCCVGKLNTASCQSSGGSQTYTGDKDVDATQRIITDISSDGGPTFDYSGSLFPSFPLPRVDTYIWHTDYRSQFKNRTLAGELFSAIEVYGGVTLEGNTQYEQIVMDIMAGMTGSVRFDTYLTLHT